MRMENVQEMPLHHTHWCVPGDEELILAYNKNDVEATYLFFLTTLGKTEYSLYKGKNKLQLRQDLTKKFGVNCINLGDVPMGEALMLQLYSKATNTNKYTLKKSGGTPRENIKLSECIPFWANIKSKEFNTFLEAVKNTVITGAKGEFKYSVIFHNYKFDFGQGGSHGSCDPKIWRSNDEWVILDLDVSSLYPSVARSLHLFPQHLGPEFMELYEKFIDDRITEKHKPKDQRDNVLIEGYKLVLNGVLKVINK